MVAGLVRSSNGELPTYPGRNGPPPLLKVFFWLVILSLYLLGGLALFLRGRIGPEDVAPFVEPTFAVTAPAAPTPTPTLTLTLAATPFPTLTPTATLYPTLTPRP
jgi:hypothetical protein